MSAPKSDFRNAGWDVYDSKKNPVNGHVECIFTSQTGQWSQPRFVKSPFILVHGLAPGLNYGQHVFEGMKACRHPNGEITIFRPEANAARIRKSAAFVSMPEVPQDLFLQCVNLAVRSNAEFVCPHDFNGSLYIRPVQFGSSIQIGLEPPDEFILCIYVQPHIGLHSNGHTIKALVLDEFDRAATRGSGKVKVGGNYASIVRWTRTAKQHGYDLLLHLDSKTQTEIEEFSTSGFIGIRDEGSIVTIVHSDSDAVLDSITVDSIAVLAESFGWRVERRPIKFTELATFTEALAAGTAAGVLSVSCIYRKATGEKFDLDADGPCYRKISTALRDIQKGIGEDRFGWCRKLQTD